ncbi:hypothetical protein TNCV_4354991 [Trichonephila clavipes]|nr:hypothetical protein TNCV_4354991 [Trichonephila clavipes]
MGNLASRLTAIVQRSHPFPLALLRYWRTDGKAVTPATFFAKTRLSVRKIDVHWTIERFKTLEPIQKVNFVPCAKSEYDRVTSNIEVNEEGQMATSLTSFYKGMKFLIYRVFLMDTNGCKILWKTSNFSS